MNKKFLRGGQLVMTLSDQSDAKIRSAIHEQIKAFNNVQSEAHRLARRPGSVRPLHIILRDLAGNLRGGLIADTYWTWLDIDDFWLPENVRGNGVGRLMLQAAEKEAVRRGCRYAKLETFSFQARGFYERCGYKVVGELCDYPPGSSLFWMVKELLAAG